MIYILKMETADKSSIPTQIRIIGPFGTTTDWNAKGSPANTAMHDAIDAWIKTNNVRSDPFWQVVDLAFMANDYRFVVEGP